MLKALGLGTHLSFLGRPLFFAAAVAGEAGVRHTIRLQMEEIDRDIALMGIETLAQMRRELLIPARGAEFFAPENERKTGLTQ